jgi:hypothetical protein
MHWGRGRSTRPIEYWQEIHAVQASQEAVSPLVEIQHLATRFHSGVNVVTGFFLLVFQFTD